MFKSAKLALVAAARRFGPDQDASTAIEYALIASGISIVIVGTIMALGTNVAGMFTRVSSALK